MSKYAYEMPTSGEFYNQLKNTIAPNLTFTQSNLFEAVSQVLMYLDGYPVLTKDGVLDIRYFNDNNGVVVEDNAVDEKRTLSEDKYVNGFLSDYQNSLVNNTIVYPATNVFGNIQRSEVGLGDDGLVMRVDYPIYKLKKVEVLCRYYVVATDFNGVTYTLNFLSSKLDITNFCFEKAIYQGLLTKKEASAIPNKENTFVYSQGSNEIEVSATYQDLWLEKWNYDTLPDSVGFKMLGYQDQETLAENTNFVQLSLNNAVAKAPRDLKYRIEYETLRDGKLLIETSENRFEGSERLDIGQGGGDLRKMGLNLFGMSLKSGNSELIRTEKFLKTENRIKVGSLYYENGDRYIATSVNEVVNGDYIISTITYTKNFNKLSQFIALDQKKRFNEVDTELVLKSEDIYKDYLYFSLNENIPTSSEIHLTSDFLHEGLTNTFRANPNKQRLDIIACNTRNLDGSNNNKYGYVYLPFTPYGSGNALCFEMSFDSPISANTSFQYNSSNQWETKDILYTSDNGFADVINLKFYKTKKNINGILDTLPQLDLNTLVGYGELVGSFNGLLYYKKPNETFALNYELLCLAYQNQDIFIGEEFIKHNGIIGNSKLKNLILKGGNTPSSILDQQSDLPVLKENITIIVSKVSSSLGFKFKVEVSGYQLDKAIKSWAIVDHENNVYISANQNLAINDTITFYIFTSNNRV